MSKNFNDFKGDKDFNFVRLDKFILATRDSGYKSTVSALSELVDNSIQANATEIHINLSYLEPSKEIQIVTFDNGKGMKPEELRQSMRFGGSTRFDSRSGLGRFGMGLPNASVSQCKRTEIHTWQENRVFETYLDIDEISEGKCNQVPQPVAVNNFLYPIELKNSKSGTMVIWRNCDRLDYKRITTLEKKLRRGLGQQFRYFLWEEKKIYLNGEELRPFDPLCLNDNRLPCPGEIFEEVILPFRLNDNKGESLIRATFTMLPLSQLYKLPNTKKSELGITKGAGMSIIRAKREIDYGWFFMDKRKENYDDWWRAELMFEPQMDEHFGVSHTKQQIRPSAELREILSNQFSPIIRALNSCVRSTSIKLKVSRNPSKSEEKFNSLEGNLPKISERVLDLQGIAEEYLHVNFPVLLKQNTDLKGHQILEDNIEVLDFFNHYHCRYLLEQAVELQSVRLIALEHFSNAPSSHQLVHPIQLR